VIAVGRLSRILLIAGDPERLAHFYESAFGFLRTEERLVNEAAFAAFMDIPDASARIITLQLGDQEIELAGIHPPGRAYPQAVAGWNVLFQHFAIVVSDMTAAYSRLSGLANWTAISTDGPVLLPPASGGVIAFKFRDPEGHPLELLAFAANAIPGYWQRHSSNCCLGIDHSAISVRDTERSVAFYEGLGLRRMPGSLNVGESQDRLDDITTARVEVTPLAPAECATPHLELLCYRDGFAQHGTPARTNDRAATQLIFTIESTEALELLSTQNAQARLSGPVLFDDGKLRALFREPDGHLICLEAPSKTA
jgi:catechol 2,3-dioxygenase-like lactoylglutathione lyase family enzyme